MTTIRCSIEGCLEIFTTAEPISPLAKFTCRYHARKIQVEASGRTYDPLKDHLDEVPHFDKYQGWERFDSFAHLRQLFGGNESFVSGSQIVKARNPVHKIPTPEWMFDDAAVEKFIQKLFPRANRNLDHRMRAIVYRSVIMLYFRSGLPDAEVEYQLNLNEGSAGRIVQDIRLAAAGRRRDGRPRSFGKAGRPKKVESVIDGSKHLTYSKTNDLTIPEKSAGNVGTPYEGTHPSAVASGA